VLRVAVVVVLLLVVVLLRIVVLLHVPVLHWGLQLLHCCVPVKEKTFYINHSDLGIEVLPCLLFQNRCFEKKGKTNIASVIINNK
jgi:hypothetical protein